MTISSKLLISISAILLAHSCYSAHEHSSASLPLDITIETIVASLLLISGIVISGGRDQFRHIEQRVWMGKLEREKGAGPWNMLEERLGFFEVRERRKEFTEWAKGGE